MATSRTPGLTDIFPGATVDTSSGSESLTIPLADLSSGGLDAGELAADDSRKIIFAIIRAASLKLDELEEAYQAIANVAPLWASGASYEVNDYVTQGGVIYQATAAHTSSSAFATDSANWQEQSLVRKPANFQMDIAAQRYASGTFGTATVSQVYSQTMTFEGSTDLKPE